MAIPQRYEEHFLSCALCGETAKCVSEDELKNLLGNHMRKVHGRRSAYDPQAYKSVTILYEGNDPDNMEQDPSRVDPMYQFSKFSGWLLKRDHGAPANAEG